MKPANKKWGSAEIKAGTVAKARKNRIEFLTDVSITAIPNEIAHCNSKTYLILQIVCEGKFNFFKWGKEQSTERWIATFLCDDETIVYRTSESRQSLESWIKTNLVRLTD